MKVNKVHPYRSARFSRADNETVVESAGLTNYYENLLKMEGFEFDNHIIIELDDDRGYPFAVQLSDWKVRTVSGYYEIELINW
jgi:hypothetical protein